MTLVAASCYEDWKQAACKAMCRQTGGVLLLRLLLLALLLCCLAYQHRHGHITPAPVGHDLERADPRTLGFVELCDALLQLHGSVRVLESGLIRLTAKIQHN